MLSDEDSNGNENETPHPDVSERRQNANSVLPFLKQSRKLSKEKLIEYEETFTTEKSQLHPNELIFPLIYKQKNINSMFKYGETWYTWATEKRTDGSTVINYYICNDEPKRCDDVGWVSFKVTK